MGFDDNDFENQLEKELENYMGRPLTDIGTNGSGEPEDEGDSKPRGLIVLLIFLLAIVTLALVWVLVVKLMYLGILPKADFGFAEWFNAHLFRLY